MEWSEVGYRIVEARLHRGLTQTQLAQSLGMERSALAKAEVGQRKVSALELAEIARELGRRLEWFVLPRSAGVPQHRGDQTPDWVTSEIDIVLEQAVADVVQLSELGHLHPTTRPAIFDTPVSGREVEVMASSARRACRVDSAAPVTDLVGAVQSVGLLVFAAPLDGGADAASTSHGSWGVAVINSANHVGRRRLALAHELGHFLLNDGFVEDFRVDAPHDEDQHEARLDRFARAFLLPESSLRATWDDLRASGVRHAGVMIASQFRVDMSTLAKRLHKDLGVIDANLASEIRTIKTSKSDIVENDLYVPHELEGVGLPGDFQKAVLGAYRADDITDSRALSLLRQTFAAEDLPQRRPVGEGALWGLTE